MTPSTVHIAAVSDKNYAQHLAVMLVSLFATTTTTHNKHIHIIDAGIDEGDKKELVRIVEGSGSKISFYMADEKIYSGLIVNNHISRAAYYRISLPDILPFLDKVLYLDCDIICRKDIDDVFGIPIENNVTGAVHDYGEYDYAHLGIPKKEFYFNSGVLLFNLSLWRSQGISNLIKNFITTKGQIIILHDQDILNAVLWDKWKDLGAEANAQSSVFVKKWVVWLPKKSKELFARCTILHFSSSFKPWMYTCDHPYKKEYDRYLRGTAWSNFQIEKPTIRRRLGFAYYVFFSDKLKRLIRKWVLNPLRIPKNTLVQNEYDKN